MTTLTDLNASLAQLEDELIKIKSTSEILQSSESSVSSLVEHTKEIFHNILSQYRLVAQENLAKVKEVETISTQLNGSVSKLLEKMKDPELAKSLVDIKGDLELLSRHFSNLQTTLNERDENNRLFFQQYFQSFSELQQNNLEKTKQHLSSRIEQYGNHTNEQIKAASSRSESHYRYFGSVLKRQDLYIKILVSSALLILFLQVILLAWLKN